MKRRQKPKQKAVLERSKFHVPSSPLVAETSVAQFPPGEQNPLGLKYRLQLYHEETKETLIRYDIHHGKDHHRHFLNLEEAYEWNGIESLFEDFRRDIEQVKRMLHEGKL